MLAQTEKPETGVAGEGERLLKSWLRSRERVRNAKREVNSAECDESNNKTALARWLLPKDASVGEKIAIWFGDALVQVECTHAGPGLMDGRVTIRQDGKTIREALWR